MTTGNTRLDDYAELSQCRNQTVDHFFRRLEELLSSRSSSYQCGQLQIAPNGSRGDMEIIFFDLAAKVSLRLSGRLEYKIYVNGDVCRDNFTETDIEIRFHSNEVQSKQIEGGYSIFDMSAFISYEINSYFDRSISEDDVPLP